MNIIYWLVIYSETKRHLKLGSTIFGLYSFQNHDSYNYNFTITYTILLIPIKDRINQYKTNQPI